jgi:hypothetical protein
LLLQEIKEISLLLTEKNKEIDQNRSQKDWQQSEF